MVFSRELSRRDFLKLSAGSTAALGLALYSFPNFEQLLAESAKNTPVIWLQGGSCTGCSISFLNSLSPKVQDVLVNKVIPGNQLSLRFHPNVMAGQGDIAMQAMEDTAKNKGGFVLIVEGTIPTKDGGVYSEVGEKDGHGVTILEHVTTLGRDAMAVISVGACSAFGGIPAAVPNPTGSKSVKAVFDENGIQTPVINIPGCPPHPDWLVSTVATILIGGLGAVDLDSIGRPRAFFSELIHDRCPRRGFFDAGKFSKRYSEPYCMFELGCKGPVTRADCGVRLWNSGTNWCVGCNSICIGCCEPGFPDSVSPFSKVSNLAMVAPPAWLPPIDQVSEEPDGLSTGMVVGLGAAGGAIAGAAITAALGATRKQSSQEEE